MTVDEQIKKAYENKVTKVHENLVRTTVIRAVGNISQATPVDTNRARANYNVTVNRIDPSVTEKSAKGEKVDVPDYEAVAKDALANYKPGDTVYITNNLPYIARLNDGYSKQAPANFVEKGVALAVRQAQAEARRGGK